MNNIKQFVNEIKKQKKYIKHKKKPVWKSAFILLLF